jgi:hypothetical protein
MRQLLGAGVGGHHAREMLCQQQRHLTRPASRVPRPAPRRRELRQIPRQLQRIPGSLGRVGRRGLRKMVLEPLAPGHGNILRLRAILIALIH